MKSLKEDIETFQLHVPVKQYRAGREVLADEMTGYFGENCYWFFRRHVEWKIRDAYRICQGKRIKSFWYLMGILKDREKLADRNALQYNGAPVNIQTWTD